MMKDEKTKFSKLFQIQKVQTAGKFRKKYAKSVDVVRKPNLS